MILLVSLFEQNKSNEFVSLEHTKIAEENFKYFNKKVLT